MTFRRRKYWILPDFQGRMIRRWVGLVFLAIVFTNLVTLGFVWYQDLQTRGSFFYVSHELGTDPIIVPRWEIILPSLLVALGIGFLLTVLAGIFYSHRLAGPLYRIHTALQEFAAGKSPGPIQLRKNDELKELAEDINRLLIGKGKIP
ncbi:MAG: hypothetical protein HY402_04200 [Elusimicrobia bacterium]|nr:hypothetical protein [Elusimicrobiota bacterium]